MGLVDILLPVHGSAPFLNEAVVSIIEQDSTAWRLIVVDDGMDVAARNFLHSLACPKLSLIHNRGVGLVSALNTGLAAASARFIARMDSDDICFPNRISSQLSCFAAQPGVGVVCSNVIRISNSGDPLGLEGGDLPVDKAVLQSGLLGHTHMKPIVHPTVMMAREAIESIGGYRDYAYAEDRDLWLRLSRITNFYRINQPLLKYRLSDQGISRTKRDEQYVSGLLACLNFLVEEGSGYDLYEQHPIVLEGARADLAVALRRYIAVQRDYSEARSAWRHKEFYKAVRGTIAGLHSHGLAFIPNVTQSRTKQLLADFAARLAVVVRAREPI